MPRRLAIECLHCGHRSQLDEAALKAMGLPGEIPLVVLTRRLVCSRCHSRAVSASVLEAPSKASA